MGPKKRTAPKAYTLTISKNALRNLDEITGYIAFIKHEPANAVKVGDAIISTIERIERAPYAFRECEALQTKTKMYRRACCLSWLIIYRIAATNITILGIMHSSRNPTGVRMLRKIR